MDWLIAVFGQQGDISIAQECARAVLILVYGLAIIRLAGRRIFGKWAALDIIVSIVVGSNLSRAMTGSAPLVGTIAATTILIALHWVLARLAARRPTLSHMFEGRPIELGSDGTVHRDVQARHAVTEADLNEALRQSGVERIENARKITLEPSGKITVVKGDQSSEHD